MASRSLSHHQIATTRSTHGAHPSPTSSDASHLHHSGYRPSNGNYLERDHPQRSAYPCIGMGIPHEEVTDVALAAEYYCLPPPCSQAWSRTTGPYDAALSRPRDWKPRFQAPQRLEASSGTRSTKRGRWADLDEGHGGLATPPRTPQIGRLDSPELEPLKCCGEFCACCPKEDEEKYYDGRRKMDSQGRWCIN